MAEEMRDGRATTQSMGVVLTDDRVSSTFDIDKEVNKDESMDYEDKRIMLKLGNFKSALLLFQGTVGLALFTMQKPLQMAGLAWGTVITIIAGYTTSYGLIVLNEIATELEADFNHKRKIKNFDELTRQINGKSVLFVKWLMMIAGVCMMYASSVSNILLISANLSRTLSINELAVKLIIFVIIALIFLVLVEPEKIQYINVYMTALLVSLAYLILGKNIYRWVTGQGPGLANIKMIDLKYTGVYAGNIAYGFEVASNYLSLRLTASNEVKYGRLTTWLMIFVGLNFYLCAAGHMVAYNGNQITENSFEMQKSEGVFWKNLIYPFMINTLYTFTFNTIFTGEIIESIPALHSLMVNHKGTFDRTKLTVFRILIWAIAVFISVYATDIVYILNFSGSVFTPIISYFGPLFLLYSYASQKGKHISVGRKIHDVLYVLIAIGISGWGIYNAF
jgi:Transmembrane amino acid transporter protein